MLMSTYYFILEFHCDATIPFAPCPNTMSSFGPATFLFSFDNKGLLCYSSKSISVRIKKRSFYAKIARVDPRSLVFSCNRYCSLCRTPASFARGSGCAPTGARGVKYRRQLYLNQLFGDAFGRAPAFRQN